MKNFLIIISCNHIAGMTAKNAVLIIASVAISFILFASFNEAKAQQCPEPPDYPDCHFQSGTVQTIVAPDNPNCMVEFFYCWRDAGPPPDCMRYRDVAIIILSTTCDPGPFDLEYYQTLANACTGWVVALNPWGVTSGWLGTGAPNCEDGWSEPIWRRGIPICTTDWYLHVNNEGKIVYETFPCNTSPLAEFCWEVLIYCWEMDVNGTSGILNQQVIQPGAPSNSVCPPVFANPYGPPPEVFNCNSLCE
jgi:hypothetical protein